MPPLKRARSSSGLEEPDEDDDGRTVLTDSSFQSVRIQGGIYHV